MTPTPRVVLALAAAVGLFSAGVFTGSALGDGSTGPGEDSAAVGFVRDMAVHHAQAVEMADVIRTLTDDPRLQLLATDITLTQQSQIGRMLGWLEQWEQSSTVAPGPMAWMPNHDMTDLMVMPGMASSAEINELSDLPIGQAEARFLDLMIRHHQGAIEMAQAILAIGAPQEVERLARSILSGQASEIDAMRLLAEDLAKR